jgi:hypothetical protein
VETKLAPPARDARRFPSSPCSCVSLRGLSTFAASVWAVSLVFRQPRNLTFIFNQSANVAFIFNQFSTLCLHF